MKAGRVSVDADDPFGTLDFELPAELRHGSAGDYAVRLLPVRAVVLFESPGVLVAEREDEVVEV